MNLRALLSRLPLAPDRTDPAAWTRMARTLFATFVAAVVGVFALVALVDPYNVVPFSPKVKRELMDINQRWLYPSVVRSGRYDSLVIGTSTSRLLDPEKLNAALGGHFANLAMNSATAWEQIQILDLYRRERGAPKTLIVGIDVVWCNVEADRERITFRGFPEWMYDDSRWNDLAYLLNFKTIEIAGRQVGNWLGLRPPRIRADGYEVFVPPEASYDLERARGHIWGAGTRRIVPQIPAVQLSAAEAAALRFPALDWLEAQLAPLAGKSRILLVAMPVHVAAQPQPGSHAAAVEATCKQRLSAMAARVGAQAMDWRIASPLTSDDQNYWDNLHFRLPIAGKVIEGLAQHLQGRDEAEDGSWRRLTP